MQKYIILNCPCYYEKCLDTPRDVYKNCVDITDCLLKQIAEKFKGCNCELINLLEIEEVNE